MRAMTHLLLKRCVFLAPLTLLALVACNDPWDRQQGEPKTFVPVITPSETHGEAHGSSPHSPSPDDTHGEPQGAEHAGQERGDEHGEAPAREAEGGH
jgi:hypothetical protein